MGVEEKVACPRCEKLFDELLGSLRSAISQMKDLAANGKGQEHESQHNPQYNRYFGCAIAMDALLREFFPERLKSQAEGSKEAVESSDEEGEKAGALN